MMETEGHAVQDGFGIGLMPQEHRRRAGAVASRRGQLVMELHQLRYLVLLGEELNFTRAAARAHVAQPALSRQIRKLEDELGVPLVDRTTRRVRLTPAGQDLVGRARRILQEVDEARYAARDTLQLLTGRVTLGMSQTPGPLDVAELFATFHDRHPGVELAVREDLSVRLADALRTDRLDLAVVAAISSAARRRLELHPVAQEDLVLVVAGDHRLAGQRSVPITELEQERLVAFAAGATIRETVNQAARQAGFEPAIAFESNDILRIRALVARGLGVAVLPRSDAASPRPEVTIVELDEALTYGLYVAWRAERRLSPAAVELRRLLREQAGGGAQRAV